MQSQTKAVTDAGNAPRGQAGERILKESYGPPYFQWQVDPSQIKTEKVQLWSKSGTMIGLRDLKWAREQVQNGTHFIVSEQAIGECATTKSELWNLSAKRIDEMNKS